MIESEANSAGGEPGLPSEVGSVVVPPGNSEPARSYVCPAWVLGLILFLVTLGLYWPATGYDFVDFDDQDYVYSNPQVQAGLNLRNIGWAFTTGAATNWHPVTWLSLMLDTSLFGTKAAGYHFTSLLLHALNAVLLLWCLRRLTGAKWRSATVAALFAWHPVHVESVAWVSERKDVLSACFGLVSLLFYTRYAQARAGKPEEPGTEAETGGRWYWLAWTFFALGLMSKPMLVTWPFILLLLDFWPLKRWSPGGLGALAREKIPFLILAAGASVVTFVVQKTGGAVVPVNDLPLGMRVENTAISYCRYLGKLFWPKGLAVLYPYPTTYWPTEAVVLAVLLLLVLSAVFLGLRRRHPFLLMGWLWYAGSLVPVIGLVQVGDQSLADRYAYIPSVGVLIMLVWTLAELGRHWRYLQALLLVAAPAAMIACLLVTRHQLGYWQNSIALFQHAVDLTDDTKNNCVVHHNLGVALLDKGRNDEAIKQFQVALRIRPNYPRAHNDLGVAYASVGRLDEAIREFQEAVRLKPTMVDAHNDLGILFAKKGKQDDAIGQFQESLRLNPNFEKGRDNLGMALAKKGQTDAAISQYQQALRLNPGFAYAHDNLGLALAYEGRTDEAISQFKEALKVRPNDIIILDTLGNLLDRKGQTDAAISEYEAGIRLNPKDPRLHYDLGIALNKQGRTDAAISQLQEVVRLTPENADARVDLGVALSGKGQIDAAISQYKEAIRLKPEKAANHDGLGNLLAQQGQTDAAISQFQAAIRLEPDYAEAHNNLGLALAKQGRINEATNQYAAAIRLNPGDAIVHVNLGNLLAGCGRTNAAIDEFREAIRLKPDYAKAHDNLGIVLASEGSAGLAMGEFREALRLNPKFAKAHINLGLALEGAGRAAEAVSEFKEVLQLEPDNAIARTNLAKALALTAQTPATTIEPMKP